MTPWLITSFAPAVSRRVIWILLSLPRHRIGVAAAMTGLMATCAGLGMIAHLRRPSTTRKGSTS
jgi:hypothetical protein